MQDSWGHHKRFQRCRWRPRSRDNLFYDLGDARRLPFWSRGVQHRLYASHDRTCDRFRLGVPHKDETDAQALVGVRHRVQDVAALPDSYGVATCRGMACSRPGLAGRREGPASAVLSPYEPSAGSAVPPGWATRLASRGGLFRPRDPGLPVCGKACAPVVPGQGGRRGRLDVASGSLDFRLSRAQPARSPPRTLSPTSALRSILRFIAEHVDLRIPLGSAAFLAFGGAFRCGCDRASAFTRRGCAIKPARCPGALGPHRRGRGKA